MLAPTDKLEFAAIAVVALLVALPGETSFAQNPSISDIPGHLQKRQTIYRTKPVRLDGPLREINISDVEVREIEAITKSRYPGAIVNISGVTTGCPCEDGPKCEDQVWVVAHRAGRSVGLQLSRIDARWQIGPVQRWWLQYSKLQSRMSAARRAANKEPLLTLTELWAVEQQLFESFPRCVTTI